MDKHCNHDWAGVMLLGVRYSQQCRKCAAYLIDENALAPICAAAARYLAQPCAVPDGMDDEEITLLVRTFEDWQECENTETPLHILMRWVEMGLLDCEQFYFTKKGLEMLATARPGDRA